jgi:hypothetical protein
VIYLIGSLRNRNIPILAGKLRAAGHEVFDDWYAAGHRADDHWRDYEKQRGRTYREALKGAAARNVFRFDHLHLTKSDRAVLVMPAGKSGHLEFGWFCRDNPGFVFFDKEPVRWDVMYQFAKDVCFGVDELIEVLGQ